ncbi:MAG TPA: hypothetical protein PKC76_00775 [Saprospiraceae bacterium]|nr:hypothetical protein [Saprospiraceae bacterium]HMP22626.1 hypothetical protein [Saprospiraceae bacterium]
MTITRLEQYLQDPTWLRNGALALALITFLGVFYIRVQLVYAWTLDLEGVEQDEIYTLQRVLAGYPVYEDPEQPPFSITQKTPLYHYLCLAVGKLTQVSPDAPRAVYLLNRWTSLLLSLCTLLIAFIIQHRLLNTSLKTALTVCALVFVCYEPHMFARPDSLYSLLFIIGIALMCRYTQVPPSMQNRLVPIIALVCAATIFAKQSGILLPAIFGGFILLLERNIIRTLWFGAYLTLIISILLWLTILLPGISVPVFIANIYKGVQNGVDLIWFWEFIYNRSYKKFFPLFVIGFVIISDWLLLQKNSTPLHKMLGFSMLLSFIFANLTGLKAGSTPSYFTEFVNITLMALPVYYRQLNDLPQKLRARLHIIMFLGLLFFIPVQTSAKNLIAPFNLADKSWFEKCAAAAYYMQQHLPLQEGEWIYTDDELLKLYLFRHILLPQDDIYMTSPFRYKYFWDTFQDGTVRYIISANARADIFTLDADFADYQPIDSVSVYTIYARSSAHFLNSK